ncbi:MAG: hypothetical protein R3C11_19960 [Planctomycetaceae bacterium]
MLYPIWAFIFIFFCWIEALLIQGSCAIFLHYSPPYKKKYNIISPTIVQAMIFVAAFALLKILFDFTLQPLLDPIIGDAEAAADPERVSSITKMFLMMVLGVVKVFVLGFFISQTTDFDYNDGVKIGMIEVAIYFGLVIGFVMLYYLWKMVFG